MSDESTSSGASRTEPKGEVVMDAAAIERAIGDMAKEIVDRKEGGHCAVVGIRRGGENLARRLAAAIEERTGEAPPLGMIDITLYRDDGFGPHDWPEVGITSINFRLREHTVILVDDVLYTGRTVRAAIDAILDYGRPKAVRLAVLIDRGQRELPFRPDFLALKLSTGPEHHVAVEVHAQASTSDVATITAGEETQS